MIWINTRWLTSDDLARVIASCFAPQPYFELMMQNHKNQESPWNNQIMLKHTKKACKPQSYTSPKLQPPTHWQGWSVELLALLKNVGISCEHQRISKYTKKPVKKFCEPKLKIVHVDYNSVTPFLQNAFAAFFLPWFHHLWKEFCICDVIKSIPRLIWWNEKRLRTPQTWPEAPMWKGPFMDKTAYLTPRIREASCSCYCCCSSEKSPVLRC